jgi:hypothetical protein
LLLEALELFAVAGFAEDALEFELLWGADEAGEEAEDEDWIFSGIEVLGYEGATYY